MTTIHSIPQTQVQFLKRINTYVNPASKVFVYRCTCPRIQGACLPAPLPGDIFLYVVKDWQHP